MLLSELLRRITTLEAEQEAIDPDAILTDQCDPVDRRNHGRTATADLGRDPETCPESNKTAVARPLC